MPRRRGETRRFRLLRTAVFGSAILVGISAAVVVLRGDEPVTLTNPSRLYSPSGHLPGQPSSEQAVSMSWTGVEGAAGYWWGMVEDRDDLPRPAIRPSGNDRRVYFRFSGSAYFVLRTAFRAGGELRWSKPLEYGPIVVRDETGRIPDPPVGPEAPGSSAERNGSGPSSPSSGDGGRGGTAFGGPSEPEATVDPRFAGEPGGPGTGSGGPGTAGEPGEPAREPGGGRQTGPGNDPGTPGRDGPDGPPGL